MENPRFNALVENWIEHTIELERSIARGLYPHPAGAKLQREFASIRATLRNLKKLEDK